MTIGRGTTMGNERQTTPIGIAKSAPLAEPATLQRQPPAREEDAFNLEEPSEQTARADRRNARQKLAAGWRGLKSAIRGDSSFFAHGYRGTLIAITAALFRVNQWGWCLLVIAACLV